MTREEVIKEYREREILVAARKVLGHYGIQATTIDRVAEEAKVAKGTIYLYFNSKDDLVHAAVIEGIRALQAETARADDPTLPPLQRLRRLIHTSYRLQSSNQDFLKTFIVGNSLDLVLDSPRGREFMAIYRETLDLIAAIFRDAIDQGAIRPIDPQFAAFMLTEMITGSLRRRVLGLASTPPEADADAVIELFLKGVQAERCG
ncbi:MAG TPA: TetR/AcrR family transcriptional regulator [Candidatus Binataceae bacterium]|nr:TetR/AcrR family transcriptional regulator [Candidatus Binataceae bacterium]